MLSDVLHEISTLIAFWILELGRSIDPLTGFSHGIKGYTLRASPRLSRLRLQSLIANFILAFFALSCHSHSLKFCGLYNLQA